MPKTVLVVEDEDLVLSYLTRLLSKSGWHVASARSGDEALSKLAESGFDAVICDLDLGRGLTGFDVLARMPPRNQESRFVMLTAHGSTSRCRDAFLLGASDFLEKPISPAWLLDALTRATAGEAGDRADALPHEVAAATVADTAGAAHVRGAIQIIERCCAEASLTIAQVALQIGVTPEHLARLFKSRIGRSPLEYLHHVRISRAERLLAESRLSVYEVAFECGYRTTSELGIWFRRLRGVTPTESRGVRLAGG